MYWRIKIIINSNNINNKIKSLLVREIEKIENENKIKILLAVESGSRAWGFPSQDSDYDVRFIFIRPQNTYLSIKNYKDTLTFPINDDLDICGWDVKKVLQHIKKSNAVMFEWFQSPIIYKCDKAFLSEAWKLSQEYYSPSVCISHYLGISNNFYSNINQAGEIIKIKKVFYVLRPLLAALWIVDKNNIPPMVFQKLLSIIESKSEIIEIINRLLSTKEKSNESTLIKLDAELNLFIKKTFEKLESSRKERSTKERNVDLLDHFFMKLLEE
ncbi:MAG: DNA polymerase beta superfamily protein [bacterium]